MVKMDDSEPSFQIMKRDITKTVTCRKRNRSSSHIGTKNLKTSQKQTPNVGSVHYSLRTHPISIIELWSLNFGVLLRTFRLAIHQNSHP